MSYDSDFDSNRARNREYQGIFEHFGFSGELMLLAQRALEMHAQHHEKYVASTPLGGGEFPAEHRRDFHGKDHILSTLETVGRHADDLVRFAQSGEASPRAKNIYEQTIRQQLSVVERMFDPQNGVDNEVALRYLAEVGDSPLPNAQNPEANGPLDVDPKQRYVFFELLLQKLAQQDPDRFLRILAFAFSQHDRMNLNVQGGELYLYVSAPYERNTATTHLGDAAFTPEMLVKRSLNSSADTQEKSKNYEAALDMRLAAELAAWTTVLPPWKTYDDSPILTIRSLVQSIDQSLSAQHRKRETVSHEGNDQREIALRTVMDSVSGLMQEWADEVAYNPRKFIPNLTLGEMLTYAHDQVQVLLPLQENTLRTAVPRYEKSEFPPAVQAAWEHHIVPPEVNTVIPPNMDLSEAQAAGRRKAQHLLQSAQVLL